MSGARDVWSQRAKEYGRRSVINLSVPEDQFESITRFQESVLLPLLAAELSAPPVALLDYGCGGGRFALGLLAATRCTRYAGYDFCSELIDIASAEINDPRVTFESGEPREFLARSGPFDLIFIHSVLGGVPDAEIGDLIASICDRLASGGLMFVAEATSPEFRGYRAWRFRREDEYAVLFEPQGVHLRKKGAFKDIVGAHDVSVFAGRKEARG